MCCVAVAPDTKLVNVLAKATALASPEQAGRTEDAPRSPSSKFAATLCRVVIARGWKRQKMSVEELRSRPTRASEKLAKKIESPSPDIAADIPPKFGEPFPFESTLAHVVVPATR